MFKVDSARVRALLLQSGLSLKQFAEQSGLNVLTVKRALRDGASATIKTIYALAKSFNVDANTLVAKS